jgi:hypothetical protein
MAKQKRKGKVKHKAKKGVRAKPRQPSMYTKQILNRAQPSFRQNQQMLLGSKGNAAFGFPEFYGSLTNNAMNAFQNQRYGLETQIRNLRAEADVIGQAGGNVDAMLQQIRGYEGDLDNLVGAVRDIGGGLTNAQREQALINARLREHDDLLRQRQGGGRGGRGGGGAPPPIPAAAVRVPSPRGSNRTPRAAAPLRSSRSAGSSVARALQFEANDIFNEARASSRNPMRAVYDLAQRGINSTGTRKERQEARRQREVDQGNVLGYYNPESPYVRPRSP